MRFEGLETEQKRVSLLAFILVTVGFTVLDGLLTLALSAGSGLGIMLARLLSVAIITPCLAYTLNRMQRAAPAGGVLLTIFSVISTGVSVGIFVLIILRNPFVQWPVAFLAASCGGLALAITGYLRARRRLDREL